MKREVERYDFKVLGQAIKAARKAKGISRKQFAVQCTLPLGTLHPMKTAGSTQVCKSFMSLLQF